MPFPVPENPVLKSQPGVPFQSQRIQFSSHSQERSSQSQRIQLPVEPREGLWSQDLCLGSDLCRDPRNVSLWPKRLSVNLRPTLSQSESSLVIWLCPTFQLCLLRPGEFQFQPGGLQLHLLRPGGFQLRLLCPSRLQFHPGGLQLRLLCPGGLQYYPGWLHLIHPGWIPALSSFMDLHCMDRALHPSWFLHCSAYVVGASGSRSFERGGEGRGGGGNYHSHQLNCTTFPRISLATHLHSFINHSHLTSQEILLTCCCQSSFL